MSNFDDQRASLNKQPIEEEVTLTEAKPGKPNAKMLVDFGEVQVMAQNYEKAGLLFNQALDADKKYLPAYIALAKMYQTQGRPEKALETLEKGSKYHKKSPELWNEIGITQARMKHYPEALAAMDKALKREPDNELFISNHAGILAVAGQPEASYLAYAKIMPAAEAHYRVAGILYSQGNKPGSVEQLQLAVAVRPDHAKSLQMLQHLSGNEINQVGYIAPPENHKLESEHGNTTPPGTMPRPTNQAELLEPAFHMMGESQRHGSREYRSVYR